MATYTDKLFKLRNGRWEDLLSDEVNRDVASRFAGRSVACVDRTVSGQGVGQPLTQTPAASRSTGAGGAPSRRLVAVRAHGPPRPSGLRASVHTVAAG